LKEGVSHLIKQWKLNKGKKAYWGFIWAVRA